MDFVLWLSFVSAVLFAGMLGLMEVGRRLGSRRIVRDPEGGLAGAGTVEGAMFALLGLLVAFTFSGAASRFDARRQLIVEEANAIGTAYLRLDVLNAEAQPPLRGLFRRYLESRLQVYRDLPDVAAAEEALAKSKKLQGMIWTEAVAASRQTGSSHAPMLLLPALNQMFDITTTRTMATKMHPPETIFWLLFILALGCSLLAGYSMAGCRIRSWTHIIGFATILAVTFYVILDIEYPRFGLIRVTAFDEVLYQLLESMK